LKLHNFFLEQEDKDPIDSFRSLRLYARDKISSRELYDSDNNISNIKEKYPKGESEVILDFDSDDTFLSLMGLGDDDIYFIRAVTNPYNTYEFNDWYSIRESMIDGNTYWLTNLSQENKDKFNIISTYLVGNPIFTDNREDLSDAKFFSKFEDLYEREFNSIVSDFSNASNAQISEAVDKRIDDDLVKFISKFDLSFYTKYDKVKTTVSDLISMYAVTGKYNLTIKQLFEHFFQEKNSAPGGWEEDIYSFEDIDKFDWDSLNWSIGRELDSVIDKLSENSGKVENFLEFYDRIVSKFKIGTWYKLPKDNDVIFSIREFDPEEMKVVISYSKGASGYKYHKFNEENFIKFLHHPELFPIWKD
jgi:hypothetical protein